MSARLRTFSDHLYGILVSFERMGVAMSHEKAGDGEAQDYVAYLLRLWRETGGESNRWRASLLDPHSGERVGFGSLEELFEFLHRQVVAATHSDER
jgi:hypothetical protein